jgi:hypothetical protein
MVFCNYQCSKATHYSPVYGKRVYFNLYYQIQELFRAEPDGISYWDILMTAWKQQRMLQEETEEEWTAHRNHQVSDCHLTCTNKIYVKSNTVFMPIAVEIMFMRGISNNTT